jgi:hypothetical protein
MLRPWRELLPRLAGPLLLGGAAWSFLAFGIEASTLYHRWRHQAWSASSPSGWRLGTPPPDRLGRFLALADSFADEPGAIAFAPRQKGHEGLVVSLWASFLLPHRDVVPGGMPQQEVEVRWLLAWQRTVERAGLESVLHTDDGVLYRVQP